MQWFHKKYQEWRNMPLKKLWLPTMVYLQSQHSWYILSFFKINNIYWSLPFKESYSVIQVILVLLLWLKLTHLYDSLWLYYLLWVLALQVHKATTSLYYEAWIWITIKEAIQPLRIKIYPRVLQIQNHILQEKKEKH